MLWAGEMAQQLRKSVALAEDLGSILNTHISLLIAFYSSSPRESDVPFRPLEAPTHMAYNHTDKDTCTQIKDKDSRNMAHIGTQYDDCIPIFNYLRL